MAVLASLLAAVTLQLAFVPSPAAATPVPPVVFTGEATQQTTTTATLNGWVDLSKQSTTYYFQYGASSAYGSQTPPAVAGEGAGSVHVTATLTGLTAGTVYHFRFVAVNATGTTDGLDRTFATMRNPLTLTLSPLTGPDLFGTPLLVSGTLSGTESANHPLVLQANPFPYLSGFSAVGAPTTTDATGHFSFSLAGLTENTELRVVTRDTPPVASPAFIAFVSVRVRLHVRRTRHRGYMRLYGTVTPAEVGAQVGFQLLRPGHRAQDVASTFVRRGSATVSRFSEVVRIKHPGLYRAFVYVVSGAQASNHSQAVRIR